MCVCDFELQPSQTHTTLLMMAAVCGARRRLCVHCTLHALYMHQQQQHHTHTHRKQKVRAPCISSGPVQARMMIVFWPSCCLLLLSVKNWLEDEDDEEATF